MSAEDNNKIKRKIMVITGTRSEYGILKPILNGIKKDQRLKLSILVTGMHLSPEFGNTYKDLISDGFFIDYTVDSLLSGDSKKAMGKSVGIAVTGIIDILDVDDPDMVLVCGDRGEAFAGAIASAYLGKPVIHLFGGDTAYGSNIDDSIRHAITKISHIHLTATKNHKQRILKLGEEPWRVFHVGNPAIDTAFKIKNNPRAEVFEKYKIDKRESLILAVYHPTTIHSQHAGKEVNEILDALIEIDKQTIFIYPNADSGGREIIETIKYKKKQKTISFFKSLPHEDFMSLMCFADIMIGNSSSLIIETPTFSLPAINVGIRQKNRERSNNIIDVKCKKEEIINATNKIFNQIKLGENKNYYENPYGDGKATERIIKIINKIKIDNKLIYKKITY